MDVLSHLLETVRLRGKVFAHTRLVAPWGIHAAACDELAFHVVSGGHCWFEVEGSAPVEISAGEVVVLAPGRSHTLRDHPSTTPEPLERLIASGAFGLADLAADAGAATTELICGRFMVDEVGVELLRAALPPAIRAGNLEPEVGPWIAQTLRLLGHEVTDGRPGKSTVVDRLCDALFVYVLRGYLATAAAGETTWLRGLTDPHVSRALQHIHDQPDRDWTVGELASGVGMSRSAFAARFQQVVGDGPIGYLIRWRMIRAAALLRAGGTTLDEVAARAGYESQAAFNKAFKKAMGLAPGAYRRAWHAAPP